MIHKYGEKYISLKMATTIIIIMLHVPSQPYCMNHHRKNLTELHLLSLPTGFYNGWKIPFKVLNCSDEFMFSMYFLHHPQNFINVKFDQTS